MHSTSGDHILGYLYKYWQIIICDNVICFIRVATSKGIDVFAKSN